MAQHVRKREGFFRRGGLDFGWHYVMMLCELTYINLYPRWHECEVFERLALTVGFREVGWPSGCREVASYLVVALV